MHRATQILEQGLRERKIQCSAAEAGSFSYVSCGFSVENVLYKVLFISGDDDLDVKAVVLDFVKFGEEKLTEVLRECNRINGDFRYVKFEVRDDNTVSVEYDFPVRVTEKDLPETAFELLIRLQDIMPKAYARLMKIIWGGGAGQEAAQPKPEPQPKPESQPKSEPQPGPEPQPARQEKKGKILDFFRKKK